MNIYNMNNLSKPVMFAWDAHTKVIGVLHDNNQFHPAWGAGHWSHVNGVTFVQRMNDSISTSGNFSAACQIVDAVINITSKNKKQMA